MSMGKVLRFNFSLELLSLCIKKTVLPIWLNIFNLTFVKEDHKCFSLVLLDTLLFFSQRIISWHFSQSSLTKTNK